MATSPAHPDQPPTSGLSGFGTVDEKGRISLPKPVRRALGIAPGSAVGYVVVDSVLLLTPQDAQLAKLMRQGEEALHSAGLSARDLADELPEAHDTVFRESYSEDFRRELERLRVERDQLTHESVATRQGDNEDALPQGRAEEMAGPARHDNHQPSPLARRLADLREHIVASGMPLLSWEEVEAEVAERRGERLAAED